jgi:AcrR family transcriptional regulator
MEGMPAQDDITPVLNPPRQKRTRESWARVLDVGVAILEDNGYAAFTIAEICARARVAPRFIYDRIETKDDLFLAVYEHRLRAVTAEQAVFEDERRWHGLAPREVVLAAVAEVGARFRGNSRFLRTIVLTSSEHDELRVRGVKYKSSFEDQFVRRVLTVAGSLEVPDGEATARFCFDVVFSAWVVRIAYGRGFAAPTLDDESFSRALGELSVASLIPRR